MQWFFTFALNKINLTLICDSFFFSADFLKFLRPPSEFSLTFLSLCILQFFFFVNIFDCSFLSLAAVSFGNGCRAAFASLVVYLVYNYSLLFKLSLCFSSLFFSRPMRSSLRRPAFLFAFMYPLNFILTSNRLIYTLFFCLRSFWDFPGFTGWLFSRFWMLGFCFFCRCC